jgi:hypothetical protein
VASLLERFYEVNKGKITIDGHDIKDLDPLSHNVVSSTPRYELTASVVIGTDCTGSYKSNYHMITTTTAPTTLVYISSKYSEAVDQRADNTMAKGRNNELKKNNTQETKD